MSPLQSGRPSRVLVGSARCAQETRERAEASLRQEDAERKLRHLAGKRSVAEAQIAAIKAGLEAEEAEVQFVVQQEALRYQALGADALRIAQTRTRNDGGATDQKPTQQHASNTSPMKTAAKKPSKNPQPKAKPSLPKAAPPNSGSCVSILLGRRRSRWRH